MIVVGRRMGLSGLYTSADSMFWSGFRCSLLMMLTSEHDLSVEHPLFKTM